MDDYGSGFSSPALLQNIPFDLIKIDMSFVKQIEQNEKTKIIITEIVRLAMALGIDTLAEGVETKAQVEFLNDIGCTMLQGFYFTKPIPMKEILDRKQRNALIGFENPSETDYYVKLGKVNLYNLSSPHLEANQLKNYFDTWPMIMVECNTNSLSVVKCNETFKTFFDTHFSTPFTNVIKDVRSYKGKAGYYSLNEIMLCAKEGRKSIIDVIQSLSAVSEENAAASQETYASTMQFSEVINKLVEDANELNVLSEKLAENISIFKTK
jgi:hypothetical protein